MEDNAFRKQGVHAWHKEMLNIHSHSQNTKLTFVYKLNTAET